MTRPRYAGASPVHRPENQAAVKQPQRDEAYYSLDRPAKSSLSDLLHRFLIVEVKPFRLLGF